MEINLREVDYIYHEKTILSKQALMEINLLFQKEKINGIIGTSGSGKTTMLELINALLIPTEGTVHVDDFVIEKGRKIFDIDELRFQVGLVFQYPEEQFFNTTVKKEIEFGLKQFAYKLDQIEKRVSDSLKMVGLNDHYLERSPFSLSSGEKRKIAIASVLALNPKVILLDEPTVGLDNKSKNSLIRMLKLLKNRYHKTIIIVSQDTDFLHHFVDYVYVLHQGRLVLEGDKYSVFCHETLEQYGLTPPKVIAFSQRVLEKKGIKIGYRDEMNDLIKDIYRYAK